VRVVLDTNQWVSGLTRPLTPSGRILTEVREGRLDPVATHRLRAEMVDVLARPKVRAYFGIHDAHLDEAQGLIRRPLLPNLETGAPIEDPKDEPVIASAIAGGAEVIVSGDAHLHAPEVVRWLGERDIRVRTAGQFMAELEAQRDEPEPEAETKPDPMKERVQALVRRRNLETYGVEDPMEVIEPEIRGLQGEERMQRQALALQRLRSEHDAGRGASPADRRAPTHERDRDLDDRGIG
jgi:uncharacterized protein